MMRSRAVACALAVALPAIVLPAVVWPAVGSAQQKFKSGVDLVRVDALVTDGRKPIAGLTPSDFELRDNGVPQSIESAALESLPLSVFFVLDTSASVAGTRMRHLGDAVDLMLNGLHGADKAALVTFSHRVWLRSPLVSDVASLHDLMASASVTGGTALRDSVYAGLAISDVPDSRPLLVAFTDGVDNASWLSPEIVEQAARRSSAVVYGVAVGAGSTYHVPSLIGGETGMRGSYEKGQTDFLDAVADTTGGRVLKADSTDRLPKAFDEILREFRTRYVITYSPQRVDAAGWHRIELKVKGRSATVKARAGYQR